MAKNGSYSLKRVFSNIKFALHLIGKASPFYIPYIILTAILGAFGGFIIDTWLFQKIINDYIGGSTIGEIVTVVSVCFAGWIIYGVLNSYSEYKFKPYADLRIKSYIQRLFFDASTKIELEAYEDTSFYDEQILAMQEANDRVLKILNGLKVWVWSIVRLFSVSTLLFFIDPIFILFALLPFLSSLIRNVVVKENQKLNRELSSIEKRERYDRDVFYLREYAAELRLGEIYRYFIEDFNNCCKQILAVTKKHGFSLIALNTLADAVGKLLMQMGSIIYATYSTIVNSSMEVGDCVVVVSSIGTVSYTINNISSGFSRLCEDAMFMENLRSYLEYEPKIPLNPTGKAANFDKSISVENISYRYRSGDRDALRDVTFTINKGERIAIVGLNGSGKTTLIKLLLHLYEPQNGRILLDGEPVNDFSLDSYRSLFGVVLQDHKLFALNIAENILLRKATEEDRPALARAAEQSGAGSYIDSLPDGLDTLISKEFSEDGAIPSGGQAQKILLTRAFCGDYPILILDEPSSSLDPIAEDEFFKNLMSKTSEDHKTIIFISHRLTCASMADRILVMQNGELVGNGKHDELMACCPHYRELYTKQAEGYKL